MELRDFNYENRGQSVSGRVLRQTATTNLAIFLSIGMLTTTTSSTTVSLQVLQSIQTHRCLGVSHQRMNLVVVVVLELCLGHVLARKMWGEV